MLRGLLRTMRPHQWVKNLFVVAPLIFARELFSVPVALRTLIGFGAFCLLSSSVYVLNDLFDIEEDRRHEKKKSRPIASGVVSEAAAKNAFVALVAASLGIALWLGIPFFAVAAAYLIQNLAYTLRLKRVAYVDVLFIAAGFELRVLAGAFAAGVPASNYLLLVTFLLATFLGFGKRRHELGYAGAETRKVLARYSERTLDVLLWLAAIATIATYAAYTLDPATRAAFGTGFLWVTTAFTVFGVLRFIHLVRARHRAESPTEEMLRDKPFVLNLLLWVVAVLAIVYSGL